MRVYNDSKVDYFSKVHVSEAEVKMLNIPANNMEIVKNIIRIKERYYLYKRVSLVEGINELIGSNLAKKLNLDTASYHFGICDETLYVLSELFYNEGYCYTSSYEYLSFSDVDDFLRLKSFACSFAGSEYKLLERVENSSIYLNLLKLIAIDLKMGQVDRCNKNLMLKIDSDGRESLAPIYDYGAAYLDKKFRIYSNPFVTIFLNSKGINKFSSRFPQIREYIELLNNIAINDVLDEIGINDNICFYEDVRNYYGDKDYNNSKILKKFL